MMSKLCRVRTDVKYMTKNELYESGWKFLAFSATLFIILIGMSYGIGDNMPTNPISLFISLCIYFGVIIFLLYFFLGGLWMLIKGLIRKKNSIPPEYIKNS